MKISEMPSKATPVANDKIPIYDSEELDVDEQNKSITFSVLKSFVRPDEATTSASGLLSAADKKKLNSARTLTWQDLKTGKFIVQ